MTAKLIDGRAIAAQYRRAIRDRTQALIASGQAAPGLAVILAGADPASEIYVRNKVRACEEVGIRSTMKRVPATVSQQALLEEIERLNKDPMVHGILVQLPLPPQVDTERVMAAIAPAKDADGFHAVNQGALMLGRDGQRPCTPLGCMRLLESVGLKDLSGKHAVVVGRSNIVGKPMAMMLLATNATVTICHSRTANLPDMVRQGDIVIAACGRAKMITGDMIKAGATVIDVGINRLPDGSLSGDVDFDAAREVAAFITPVPGGVGPMTIAMLLNNTLQAAETAYSDLNA